MKVFVFVLSILIANSSDASVKCRVFVDRTISLVYAEAPEEVLDYHFEVWKQELIEEAKPSMKTFRLYLLSEIYNLRGRGILANEMPDKFDRDSVGKRFCSYSQQNFRDYIDNLQK